MAGWFFNCMDYQRDTITPKIHPTQKSIHLLKNLILLFTDPGDVVIDPCAGSGTTLLAAHQLGRKAYGFEIKREYVRAFKEKLLRMYSYLFTICPIVSLEGEKVTMIKIQMKGN